MLTKFLARTQLLNNNNQVTVSQKTQYRVEYKNFKFHIKLQNLI